jgi:hypothetical protein
MATEPMKWIKVKTWNCYLCKKNFWTRTGLQLHDCPQRQLWITPGEIDKANVDIKVGTIAEPKKTEKV